MAHRYKAKKNALQIILLTLMWIVLIPVILAVVLAGSLYVYLNLSGFSYDTQEDIAIIAAEKPMAAEERYVAVDPAASSFTVAVNKSDVYWVAARENLLKPLVFDAEDLLAKYDFALDKYGLYLADGRMFVTARLLFQNFLYVPVRAELYPAAKDGSLVFYLKDMTVGRAVHVPLARLGFDADAEPVYTLEEDTHPRMKKLINAELSGDTMLLIFAFDEKSDLFDEARAMDYYSFGRLDYLSCDAALIRNEALTTNPEYDYALPGSAMRNALDKCAAEPAYLLDLKVQELAVAVEKMTDTFFIGREPDYCARFSPTLTKAAVAERRTEYDTYLRERTLALDELTEALYTACCDGRITLDTDMVYLDGAAFTASALMGDRWADYEGWLDETTVTPMLANELTARNTLYKAKTIGLPLLEDMVVSKAAANGLALNKRCPLALLVQMPVGTYRCQYLTESDLVKKAPVDALLYRELTGSGAVPRWPAVDTGLTQILSDAAMAAGYTDLDQVETLALGENVTDMQYPELVTELCRAVKLYLPRLKTLDLTGNPYISKNIKAILQSNLPDVEILFPAVY